MRLVDQKYTSQEDYFFIAQQSDSFDDYATVFANGQGKEVLRALTRASLLQQAYGMPKNDREYGVKIGDKCLGGLIAHESFPSAGVYRGVLSDDQATYTGEAINQLSVLLSYSRLKERHQRLRTAKVLRQLTDGQRSANDVMIEFETAREDRQLLHVARSAIFDSFGRRLSLTSQYGTDPIAAKQSAPQLSLQTITRRRVKDEEEQALKDILFAEVPSKATAKAVETILPKRFKDGEIDHGNPVTKKGLQLAYLYGYQDGDEFVPVLDGRTGNLV